MVRLVFRPYTKVWRSICTSESLRTSTRVSSGFVLPRHSSPSFGSQRVRSHSAPPTWRHGRAVGAPRLLTKARIPTKSAARPTFTFIAPLGLCKTQRLAHMLDSLVRVSRRVGVGDRPTRRRPWAPPREASPDQRRPPYTNHALGG